MPIWYGECMQAHSVSTYPFFVDCHLLLIRGELKPIESVTEKWEYAIEKVVRPLQH